MTVRWTRIVRRLSLPILGLYLCGRRRGHEKEVLSVDVPEADDLVLFYSITMSDDMMDRFTVLFVNNVN